MNYLLDTCIVSDFIKGDLPTLNRIKETLPLCIGISTISLMEIHYGLYLNPDRARKIEAVVQQFIDSIQVLSFTEKDAVQAAQIRSVLKIRGTPIGAYDVLLAGCAMSRNLIFVTANSNEFTRVNNLNVENWRSL